MVPHEPREAPGDDDVVVIPEQPVCVGKDVEEWIRDRVHACNVALPSGPRFFKYWDIRRVVYEITQSVDYTTRACLYLAANSNRQGSGASSRNYSVVGFNRNPVESVAARNSRGGKSSKRRGWALLVYVELTKYDFSASALKQLSAQLNALKGLEAKVSAIVKFGLTNNAPVRISPCIFETTSRWFMPNVQRSLSSRVDFVDYACSFAGTRT